MVKHFMDDLDLFNLFTKYVPASSGSLAEHAESLCILLTNIICENKPFYNVKDWLSQYSDGLGGESESENLFTDDRLARGISELFNSDRNSLMRILPYRVNACKKIRDWS